MLKVYRFTAEWCGPCKMMTPTVERLVTEYNAEGSGVEVVSIDVDADDNRELAAKYGVKSIPTLVFEKDGAEVDRTTGLKQYNELNEKIQAHK
jgi:thioredoxin 1